ncbi:MAG: WYL domain-containing protein [Spirochaetes bacterium]|nr:WYL domain-containing protein [Spirochaetota bacterium]
MGKKLAYERYYWLQGQLKADKYPNARILSERFEISVKQAQRDIEFMRDRLEAPLIYHSAHKGYGLEDNGYELPPIWFKEDELMALCLALRLASTLPDISLKKSLYTLLKKFLNYRFLDNAPSLEDLSEKVSVKNIAYYRVDEAIFHKVLYALFNEAPIEITYYTPHKHELTERVIKPLHLFCYMGSWHLIAFCTLKSDLRDFALSRIRTMKAGPKSFVLPEKLPRIKDYIRKNFGLLSGGESIEVSLKFTPEISSWISEQVWFSGQEVSADKDGSLCLRFPVADFGEIKREILKYGSSVEVLAPEELRAEIKREIKRMGKVYG